MCGITVVLREILLFRRQALGFPVSVYAALVSRRRFDVWVGDVAGRSSTPGRVRVLVC